MSKKRWLDSLEPEPMLDFLGERTTLRKLRLLACAACRFNWDKLVDQRSRNAIAVAELFADGQTSADELIKAYREACDACNDNCMAGCVISSAAATVHHACWHGDDFLVSAKQSLACAAGVAVAQAGYDVDSGNMALPQNWEMLVKKRENGKMARLVREVFGNPFKNVEIETTYLTTEIVSLAKLIYEQQVFNRMQEIGDLFVASGYEGKELIEHFRDPRPHYRGCWAIDLVLGKS